MKRFLESISCITKECVVDFSDFKFYIPAATLALLCTMEVRNAKRLPAENLNKYLQRIDFFKILRPDLEFKETFSRHEELNFCVIQKISKSSNEQRIAKNISNIIRRNKAFSDAENVINTIEYSIGEIVRNVIQHSNSHGYICAQYYKNRNGVANDVIKIGIADPGIGILESFKQNNSEFYTPNDTHLSMLKKALRDRTSSKFNVRGPYDAPDNQGVGLTRIAAICAHEDVFGYFFIATGDAFYYRDGRKPPVEGTFHGNFQGTVLSITLPVQKLDKIPFVELLSETEQEASLPQPNSQKIDELFI